jgi:hypothetical protein
VPEHAEVVIAGDRTSPGDAATTIVEVLIGRGVVSESGA